MATVIMAGTGDSGQKLGVVTCGCASEMHRVCDLCDGASGRFVACSLTCLDRHLADQHGGDDRARESSETRAQQYLRGVNRRLDDSWQRYHEHRSQVMALALAAETVPAAEATCAGDIAIFGAGNGTDLDLPRLADT